MKRLLIVTTVLIVVLAGCRRDAVETPTDTAAGPALPAGAPVDTGTIVPLDTAPTATTPMTTAPPIAPSVTAPTPVTMTTTQDPLPDAAPAPVPQIVDGQTVYRAKCASCHGLAGRTTIGGVTLASAETQAKSIDEIARLIREGSGRTSAAAHRALRLNDEQVQAVAAYVEGMN